MCLHYSILRFHEHFRVVLEHFLVLLADFYRRVEHRLMKFVNVDALEWKHFPQLPNRRRVQNWVARLPSRTFLIYQFRMFHEVDFLVGRIELFCRWKTKLSSPQDLWRITPLDHQKHVKMTIRVREDHIKQIRRIPLVVRPKKMEKATPCGVELSTLLNCWKMFAVDDAHCMDAAKSLTECVSAMVCFCGLCHRHFLPSECSCIRI
jgi:hypothetical protein